MGSYMMKEAHRACMNQGDGVLAFAHVLNVFVPTIFCILGYIFLLNVDNYAFTFLFSFINLWSIIASPTQDVGKGKGGANPMWTQCVYPGAINYEWGYIE